MTASVNSSHLNTFYHTVIRKQVPLLKKRVAIVGNKNIASFPNHLYGKKKMNGEEKKKKPAGE